MLYGLAVLLPWAATGQGTFRVHFDQSAYSVIPGGTVSVGVLLDPVPEEGLFSYGLKIAFDQTRARVESASSVSIPPPLDFNGVLGPGAIRSIEDGSVAIKGTVDFFILPPLPYDGALLAIVLLKDLGGEMGAEYSLALELYRTLGESESVFVDGLGTTLDSSLLFGTALVHVIPEPTALMLAGVALVCWCCFGPGIGSGCQQRANLPEVLSN